MSLWGKLPCITNEKSNKFVAVMSTSSMGSSSEFAAAAEENAKQSRSSQEQVARPAAPVQIRIQRVYLSVISLTMLTAIVVLMTLCVNGGITLETFDSKEKDSTVQTTLVSQYNSYSGYLVSAFTQPIELFFPMVIAVAFLCFATEYTLRGSTSSQSQYAVFAATVAAMYLLNTGFSAINVQLAPQPPQLFMSARDLTQSALDNDADLVPYTGIQRMPFESTSNKSLREDNAKNLFTNTFLRNSIESEELNPRPQCKGGTHDMFAKSLASYGFPSRRWHSNAFREAMAPTQAVKLVLQNSTSIKFTNRGTTSGDGAALKMPMGKYNAVNLALLSIAMATPLLGLWGTGNQPFSTNVIRDMINEYFIPTNEIPYDSHNGADYFELPLLDILKSGPLSNSSTDEDVLKFLNKVLLQFVSQAANVSAAEVEVEFTQTNLTAGVTFDAITLEIPLRKTQLHRRIDDSGVVDETPPMKKDDTTYYEMRRSESCSQNACVIADEEYAVLDRMANRSISVRPQVMALAACWNNKSREDPIVKFALDSDPRFICPIKSRTSMYIVSVGKRIQGDEITSRSVPMGSGEETIVSLKNVRKVYSLTVGLLSWETRDLADLYGAKCLRSNDTMCRGLSYELQSTSPRQHLLVGSRRLPVDSLEMMNYDEPHYTEMTSLAVTADIVGESNHGMVVLPRNFDKVSWPSPSEFNNTKCSTAVEGFVHRTEMNHLYIQKTLQPAYTAAFFFLFQDGIVRDVVNNSAINPHASSVALAFLKNVQLIDIKLSSPLSNAISTLVAAVFLFVITIAIVICGNQNEAKLQQALDAHNIAEALINDRKFPPLLLKPTIDANQVDEQERGQLQRNGGKEAARISSLDGFRIERGVLTHTDRRQVVLDLRAKDRLALVFDTAMETTNRNGFVEL